MFEMIFKKLLLFFIFAFVIHAGSYSQFYKAWKSKSCDSNYFCTYPKVVGLYLTITDPYLKFVFKDVQSGRHLDFSPSQRYNLGIGMFYKFLNLSIGTGISFFKSNQVRLGETKYTDIQMHYIPRRFANDIYYQKYHGFYVKNSLDFPDYHSSTAYHLRPDISAELIMLSSNYLFNYRKFSFKNSFDFNETQLKSAGSLLAGAFFSRFKVTGDSSVVTSPFTSYFSLDGTIQTSVEHVFGVNIGYVYTQVIRQKFHATLMLMEGVGLYKIKYTLTNETNHAAKLNLSEKANLRMSFGYDTGKIIIGVIGIYDRYYFQGKTNSVFNFDDGSLRFFACYRFDLSRIRNRK
jgi:hypothetical protein